MELLKEIGITVGFIVVLTVIGIGVNGPINEDWGMLKNCLVVASALAALGAIYWIAKAVF